MTFDFLPREIKKAVEQGESADFQPETVGSGERSVYFCSDCDTYHFHWVEFGLHVDHGELYLDEWHCDQDGNWDIMEWYHIGYGERMGEQIDEIAGRINQECQRSEVEYTRYVAQTGDDPLHEFYVEEAAEGEETWQVKYAPSILGGIFKGGRRNSRGPWLMPDDDDFPEELRWFLILHDSNGYGRWVTGLRWPDGEKVEPALTYPDLKKSEEIKWQRVFRGERMHDGCTDKGVVKVMVKRPRSERAVRAERKRAARKALEQGV